MTLSRADEILLQLPQLIPTVKEIYSEVVGGNNDLYANFKRHDMVGNGLCRKEEFINVMFASVKSVKPADLMKFVLGFTNGYEEGADISYDDFLRSVDHYGSAYNNASRASHMR